MNKILIIDDDIDLSQLLATLLELEGYEVEAAYDGRSGLNKALSNQHQLILLDVMLPQLNGFEVLQALRQQSSVPVLMLTAKGDEIDRVIGLEFGADDYLPKPFNDRELLARIKPILRRTTTETNKITPLTLDDIALNPGSQEAKCQEKILDLTGTEFLLLIELTANVGQLIEKESLNLTVLGKKLQAFDRSLDMHMSNLRKKLPPRLDNKQRIKTVRGRGYIWLDHA